MRSEICLILTSSIQPLSDEFVRRNDPALRLADYKQAFEQWLSKQSAFQKIVYADNSGHSLSELESVARRYPAKQVEFLSYRDSDSSRGKGYCELGLIRYALEHSKLMCETDYFAKANGRIFVENIEAIARRLPAQFDCVASFKKNLCVVLSHFILFRKHSYLTHIQPAALRFVDDTQRKYLEEGFAKAILSGISHDMRWYPFPAEPRVSGILATKSKRYEQNAWYSFWGTLISGLFHTFYGTANSKSRMHVLEARARREQNQREKGTTISVVLTVHNKEGLIERVITSIFNNVSPLVKEIIVVLDGCTDRSEQILRKHTESQQKSKRIIYEYTPDVFETKANNAGLKRCSSDYALLIQDDMVIEEKHFDRRLLQPFLHFDDVFAVTAKNAVNDVIRNGRVVSEDRVSPRYLPRNVFAVRDVVNRGPLMIKRSCLEQLDYLDEWFAPQDYDEHDLCLRAYRDFGWVCGAYSVRYTSKRGWHSSIVGKNADFITRAKLQNEQKIIARHRDLLAAPKHTEDRIIEYQEYAPPRMSKRLSKGWKRMNPLSRTAKQSYKKPSSYPTYESYLDHQREKTSHAGRRKKWAGKIGVKRKAAFLAAFARHKDILSRCRNAACLGARLGQEVEVLRELGLDAIGIDLVPHEPLVIRGDFHHLPFENQSQDFVFTNSYDHALRPQQFLAEIERVLKPGGYVVFHLQMGRGLGKYDVTQISSSSEIISRFDRVSVESDGRMEDCCAMNWEIVLRKEPSENLVGHGKS
ncbi:MAG: glycosyltransferase [Candidatus Omnitrophota bacterium]|nr:glycosyltransferase [Candidatus Omnitrophota bacterium]